MRTNEKHIKFFFCAHEIENNILHTRMTIATEVIIDIISIITVVWGVYRRWTDRGVKTEVCTGGHGRTASQATAASILYSRVRDITRYDLPVRIRVYAKR